MTERRTLTVAGAVIAGAVIAGCSSTSAPAARSLVPSTTPPSSTGAAPTAVPSSKGAPTSTKSGPKVAEVNPSGDIPDNQAYVAFRPAGGGYSVRIPEGWSRSSTGTVTSFSDKLNGIQMSATKTRTPPTVSSVMKRDVPAVKATVSAFQMGTVSEVTRHGGRVVLLTYRGTTAPDQVTGKRQRDAFERYTFYRAGERVDLTLSGPTGADNVDPWRIVSSSLRWS